MLEILCAGMEFFIALEDEPYAECKEESCGVDQSRYTSAVGKFVALLGNKRLDDGHDNVTHDDQRRDRVTK
jgi:hypothetical protein